MDDDATQNRSESQGLSLSEQPLDILIAFQCVSGCKYQDSMIKFLFSKYYLGCCAECGLMRG